MCIDGFLSYVYIFYTNDHGHTYFCPIPSSSSLSESIGKRAVWKTEQKTIEELDASLSLSSSEL
jgi:hypothetical protein